MTTRPRGDLARLAHALAAVAVVALGLGGCFKVGDDDSGAAGQSGDSSGGKGGSGSGGSAVGGMSAAAGKGGESCGSPGALCAQNTDCCDYSAGMAYCDVDHCAPTCERAADCNSGCCHAIAGGAKVCGPVDRCADACVDTGGDCSVKTCCSVAAGTGFCVADTCVDACKRDSDCDQGCCLKVFDKNDQELGSACAPPDQCP